MTVLLLPGGADVGVMADGSRRRQQPQDPDAVGWQGDLLDGLSRGEVGQGSLDRGLHGDLGRRLADQPDEAAAVAMAQLGRRTRGSSTVTGRVTPDSSASAS